MPAGHYNVYHGTSSGTPFVEVRGEAEGNLYGFILALNHNESSAGKTALVCVREGSTLIVRGLEMPSIGTAVYFAMPHGARLLARNAKHNGYTQLAEAPMLLERIPITLNANNLPVEFCRF